MGTDVYDLKWGQELANKISGQIKTEIGRIRATPPLIPIVPGASRYEDVVQSYQVKAGPPPFTIQPTNKLAPIKISSSFALSQQQFSDETLAARLALRPASDLAFAEDDIILHGERATLGSVADENQTLNQQEGLFATAPAALGAGRKVFESIRDALATLQTQNQRGPYCVILSPELHGEAMTPLTGELLPQIDPILPQLREGGLRWSGAATGRTGVAISLGGGAIDLAIPWDTHVECRKVDGDATFVVVQQFRLRINDRRAVEPLK